MRRRVLALAVAQALVLGACATTPARDAVTVFAAASLRGAFTDIAALDPALDVRFSFDGSPTLVDQLAAGAPADVLATADDATMGRADAAGLVGPATVVATNEGVLVVPRGNPGRITGLDASLEGRRLVVCAPGVPCGATALALARAAGVTLRPVSEELNVTDVRGKVVSGEADAGIVFATEAAAARDAVETLRVPGAAAHATRYPIAVTTSAPHPQAAARFLALVTGERGRAVLARHGFGTP